MKSIDWKQDCLACNPFEGDFGEPGDRTLKDVIGKVRKPFICTDCTKEVNSGSTARIRTEVIDGEIRTYRWCVSCCKAMARSWKDNGLSMTNRTALARGIPLPVQNIITAKVRWDYRKYCKEHHNIYLF